jgi:hypothetical protein
MGSSEQCQVDGALAGTSPALLRIEPQGAEAVDKGRERLMSSPRTRRGDLFDGDGTEREEANDSGFRSSGEVEEGCCGLCLTKRSGEADSASPCESRSGIGGAGGGLQGEFESSEVCSSMAVAVGGAGAVGRDMERGATGWMRAMSASPLATEVSRGGGGEREETGSRAWHAGHGGHDSVRAREKGRGRLRGARGLVDAVRSARWPSLHCGWSCGRLAMADVS